MKTEFIDEVDSSCLINFQENKVILFLNLFKTCCKKFNLSFGTGDLDDCWDSIKIHDTLFDVNVFQENLADPEAQESYKCRIYDPVKGDEGYSTKTDSFVDIPVYVKK